MDTMSWLADGLLIAPASSWILWLLPLFICAILVYGIEKTSCDDEQSVSPSSSQQRIRESCRSSVRFVNQTPLSSVTVVVVDETDDRFQ